MVFKDGYKVSQKVWEDGYITGLQNGCYLGMMAVIVMFVATYVAWH